MMLCWILIFLTLRFLKAEDQILYAHVGGTVILHRDSHREALVLKSDLIKNLYVNWYCGSEGTSCISRNPHGGISKGAPRFSLLSDFSLQISPVEETDFVLFRCEQHVLTDTYSKIYRLLRVTVPKVQAINAGDSLSLKCELEENPLTASVKWIPPKASGCNLNIQPLYGNHISVSEVPVCASGVWTCNVKYKGVEYKATTTVYVIDLSSAPADPVYTSISVRSGVNIPCSLSSDIPWTVLNESGLVGGSWSFTPYNNETQKQLPKSLLSLSVGPKIHWNAIKDAYISVQGREVKDKDLSILNLPISEKIVGEYTCSLIFKEKTFKRTIKVELLQVSFTTDSPAGPRIFEGQKVNLMCSLAHHNITPKDYEFKWKCSSCSSHPLLSSSPHPASLIMPVRMEDKGRWTCELWKNQTMLTSAWLSLNIVKVPVDIWLCVAISSGVVVFILLIVIIIIAIRRYKQKVMYRRRKTKFCCCKNPQQKGFYKT